MIYRSTLAKESRYLDWKGVALLAAAAAYLFTPPGVLPGLYDLYILAPWQRSRSKVYTKEDLILGKRLGQGGFGEVYRAELVVDKDKPTVPVVVKKAREFGEAEVWMNERMSRVGGAHVADLITAFAEGASSVTPASQGGVGSRTPAPVWLVWRYEGKDTLWDLMLKKEWPYNLEEPLFGRELRLSKGPSRRAAVMKAAMQQLLEAVKAMHLSGLVHRDLKPQNCIISTIDNKLKLIDLGAAADLRIGINYVPNEYLLDPRYAPPQMYIMSTQTPKPPPKPIATLLSPVLWLMEGPDKFDMYSVGMIMLQMMFASLRNDDKLIAFNRKLEGLGYDLRRWRLEEERRNGFTRDDKEAFDVLDLNGGQGWDLLCSLLAFNPRDRLTAAEALAHPWLAGAASDNATLLAVSSAVSPLMQGAKAVGTALSSQSDLFEAAVSRDGSLTEAQLMEELGEVQRASAYDRSSSQTVAWFADRQQQISKKLQKQRGAGSSYDDLPAAVAPSSKLRLPMMFGQKAGKPAVVESPSSKLRVPAMPGAGAGKAKAIAAAAANGKGGQGLGMAFKPVGAAKPTPAAKAKAAAAAAAAKDASKFDLFGFLKRDKQ